MTDEELLAKLPPVIKLGINLSKLDKSQLSTSKSGDTFLNATLLRSREIKYDNHFMIVQDVSQESGDKGPILGNAKLPKKKESPEEGDYERQRANESRAPATDPDDHPF